jgi:hypothetical protein
MTQVDVSRLFVNLGSINCGIACRKRTLDISCSIHRYVASCLELHVRDWRSIPSVIHVMIENMRVNSILFPLLDDLSLTLGLVGLSVCVCLSTPCLISNSPNSPSSVSVAADRTGGSVHDLLNGHIGAELSIGQYKGGGDVLVRDIAEVVVRISPHSIWSADFGFASCPVGTLPLVPDVVQHGVVKPEERVSRGRVHVRHLSDHTTNTEVTPAVGEDTGKVKLQILHASVELEEGRCRLGEGDDAGVKCALGKCRSEVAAETAGVVCKAIVGAQGNIDASPRSSGNTAFGMLKFIQRKLREPYHRQFCPEFPKHL